MFEWFDELRSQVKNPLFFVLTPVGSLSPDDRARLPAAYTEFLAKYGAARLFRERGYYLVGVRAPAEAPGDWLHIGHYHSAIAGLRRQDLVPDSDAPVYEIDGGRAKPTGLSFEAWLKHRCASARKSYSVAEWKRDVAAPKPFTEYEAHLVKGRQRFEWRHVGFDPSGEARFEVHNGSDVTLPFLTIGARSKDNRIDGKLWLKVQDIQPNVTKVVRHVAYKDQVARDEIEFYKVADPTPGERDEYWEFRSGSKVKS